MHERHDAATIAPALEVLMRWLTRFFFLLLLLILLTAEWVGRRLLRLV